jgi:hypothetical protein
MFEVREPNTWLDVVYLVNQAAYVPDYFESCDGMPTPTPAPTNTPTMTPTASPTPLTHTRYLPVIRR